MTRPVIVGIAAALVLCGCGRGRSTQQQTSAGGTTNAADTAVTIAGCLVPDAANTQRDAARDSRTPPPPGFTLVDVTIPARSAARSGVSGTSGSGGRTTVETGTHSYGLIADSDRLVDLQRFANSRVEVSGSIVAATGAGDERRLRVSDVRQLERTCEASKEK